MYSNLQLYNLFKMFESNHFQIATINFQQQPNKNKLTIFNISNNVIVFVILFQCIVTLFICKKENIDIIYQIAPKKEIQLV